MINTPADGINRDSTKKTIIDSYLALLHKRNADVCSVKDICEKAGIHKSTFYRHFDSISGLQQSIVARVMEQLDKILNDTDFSDFLCGRREFLRKLSTEIKTNILFYSKLVVVNHDVVFLSTIKSSISRKLKEATKKNTSIPETRINIFFNYVVSGTIAVYREWIRGGCAESIDDIATVLEGISSNGFASMLN